MNSTSARSLLRDLDPLPYPRRQHHLAVLARQLDRARLRPLVEELHASDPHGRRVGLRLAAIAGDADYVLRCLSAPETRLRAHAVLHAVRLGVALPADLVDDLPAALRKRLYKAVRAHRRHELAAALLPRVRARFGDHEAVALLVSCPPEIVAAALPELGYAVGSWSALARAHPGPLLDHVEAELDRVPRANWPGLWNRLGQVLAEAAGADPRRVLTLLERTAGVVALPSGLWHTIGLLARHDPARLLRVLLDPRRVGSIPVSRGLWRALLGCADDELGALARVLRGDQLPGFLHTLPPSRRAAVYAAAIGDRDLVAAGIPLDAVDELPRAARAREAERLLGLRSGADDPGLRLAVTARTDWATAGPVLAEATRRSTADERAEAYPLAIAAAAATRDRVEFGAYLGTLTRLRNEQAPVRSAALHALAKVPPWLYGEADIPALTALLTDAAESHDRSASSSWGVRLLASLLIREGTARGLPALLDCGLAALTTLGDKTMVINLHGVADGLPHGAERAVHAALAPRLANEARRGHFDLALALAAGLGERAWDIPGLQAVIDQARRAKDDTVVRSAIELWLAPPTTRGDRVAQVLRADRSTIVLPAVRAAVARRRTDLLDDVLARPARGRFLSGKVHWIPEFTACFDAWLPRQCARYAALLTEVANDTTLEQYARTEAVRRLRHVPGAAPALRELSRSPVVVIAEAALAGLAWTEEPGEVLPDLLAWADTDRARVAIHAVARSARFIQPSELAVRLAPMLAAKKVTTRKEVLRLLATHHVPGAAEIIANAFRAPDQHRDIRRAAASASRHLLDSAAAWQTLTAAAQDELAVAGAVLETWPHSLPERHRPPYATLIRTVAMSNAPDTAREGLRVLPGWSQWDTAGTAMLVDLVTDLSTTATWRFALTALTSAATTTGDPTPVLEAVHRLLAAGDNQTSTHSPAPNDSSHLQPEMDSGATSTTTPTPATATPDSPAEQSPSAPDNNAGTPTPGKAMPDPAAGGRVPTDHQDTPAATTGHDPTRSSVDPTPERSGPSGQSGPSSQDRAVAGVAIPATAGTPGTSAAIPSAETPGDPVGREARESVRSRPAPDRDLPARQRLHALAAEVAAAAVRGTGRELATAVGAALVDDTWRPVAVDLGLAAITWESVDPAALRAVHALAGGPVQAWQAAQVLRSRLGQVVSRLPDDSLLAVARDLVPDAPAFALGVTTVTGESAGWPTRWRDILDDLREHPDPHTRTAALAVFTRPE
ncbi:hypothetical protein [Actinokineospora sp. NBRC 105648]|uniref:hypothetical protein n=1 Tax=Actinokineospora sp. NBRC 105648 TaxID=3032206 RepID=UPI002552F8E3|nr:hypothetical protein [Actinokineospora sp. NBRC 105648]